MKKALLLSLILLVLAVVRPAMAQETLCPPKPPKLSVMSEDFYAQIPSFKVIYEVDYQSLPTKAALYTHNMAGEKVHVNTAQLVKIMGIKTIQCESDWEGPEGSFLVGFRLAGQANVAFSLDFNSLALTIYDPRYVYFWPEAPLMRLFGGLAAVNSMLEPYFYESVIAAVFPVDQPPAADFAVTLPLDGRRLKDPFVPAGPTRYLDPLKTPYRFAGSQPSK